MTRSRHEPRHSITWSASSKMAVGASMPSAFATLRLRTVLDASGLLHRRIGRPFALEDAASIAAGQAYCVRNTCSVAHQTTGLDAVAGSVDRGHRIAGPQRSYLNPIVIKQRIAPAPPPLTPSVSNTIVS